MRGTILGKYKYFMQLKEKAKKVFLNEKGAEIRELDVNKDDLRELGLLLTQVYEGMNELMNKLNV